jgi:hypothetical protein
LPSVVLDYADILLSRYELPYDIYFDIFFTTLPLIEALRDKGIKATGTIRKNRMGNCPLVSNADLKKQRGSCDFRTTDDKSIVIAKWVRFRPRAEKKGYILSRDSEVTLSHWSRSIELVTMPLIDL